MVSKTSHSTPHFYLTLSGLLLKSFRFCHAGRQRGKGRTKRWIQGFHVYLWWAHTPVVSLNVLKLSLQTILIFSFFFLPCSCSVSSIGQHGFRSEHVKLSPILLWGDALWSVQLCQHPDKLFGLNFLALLSRWFHLRHIPQQTNHMFVFRITRSSGKC